MTKKIPIISADAKYSCSCCSHFASKSASTSVSNIWIRRNSSEAVSQLLAPDLSQDSSTYTTVDASEGRRTIYSTKDIKKNPNRSYRHPNYCYCSERPIRPKLKLKPRDLEEERPKFRHSLEGQWTEWQTHGVKRIPKSYDEQIYERERSSGQNNTEVALNYTEKRKEYEGSKSSGQNEEFEEHDGVNNKNEDERTSTNKEATEVDVGRSSATNKQTSEGGAGRSSTSKNCHEKSCKCTFSDIDKESGIEEKTTSDKIRELSKFRNSNFFETHSVKTNSASCAPDHKCVHKFRINDRFLPEPVHCDDFGISRCTICNKPMEQASSRQTTPSTYSTRRKKSKHNNVKKIYEYNLIPPRLNIGTGKEVVEISVPQKERDCLGESHNFDVAKSFAPVKSFALRFQKGVI